MASVTPPYFFDEFLSTVKRKTPTPRERELGFTVKDLEWLHTQYYATDAARMNAATHGNPMRVERLLVNLADQPARPLAGSFMMSPTPDDAKAVLYTPYGGLELFDSHADLLDNVTKRLTQPSQRNDLLRFVSIGERDGLPADAHLTLTTAVIQGAVMQDQEHAILAGQHKNALTMLDELRKLPSLRQMLDTLLGIMARPYFPGLNQGDTRVNAFSRAAAEKDRQSLGSEPLREALLRFYVQQGWPAEQTHTFFNPAHDTSAFTQDRLADDQQRWDNVVEHTSGILSTLLNSLLQTYWNEELNGNQSRLRLFTRGLRDTFRADLLLKHQATILSTEESLTLQALFLPDHAARSAFASHLNIEKVRVHAPFQHYVDLASTLMMSNTHAYLYTQSRGLQVLEHLDDLRDTLLSMLKAAGHEDELLNFLSLDERSVFIGMEHIQVTGQPIAGDVFQEMVEDIIAEHDLRTLPHVLLDNNRANLSHGMLQGLSGEVALRRLNKSLSPANLAVLDSVFHADGMTRLKRRGLNGFIPDAFGLTVEIGIESAPVALAHCFVLTERGGLDPVHSGAALLWTPRRGFEAFASVKVLREAIERRLQDPLERLPLMENLPVSKRVPHQACHLGPLRRIDDASAT